MESLLALVAPIVAMGALYVVAPVVAGTYSRFRGPKVVICPENQAPAEIVIDAAQAAATAAVGRADLRVVRCSRWPERHYCDHGCVRQLS